MNSKILLISALVSLAVSADASAANLIDNNDFSLGNADFSTSYKYVADGTQDGLSTAGTYSVGTNPSVDNPIFYNDAGNSTNKYLIVNGAAGLAPNGQLAVVYGANKSFAAGTYDFSASVADICCNAGLGDATNSPSQLSFQIGYNLFETEPIEIAQYTTNPSDVGQFDTVSASFTATQSFVFRIIDESLASSGNDFAIDNLVLTTAVPEPSTWAMMILGFVGIGAMSYRRRAGSSNRRRVKPKGTLVAH